MAKERYTICKQKIVEGGINWLSDTIKAILIDSTQYGLTVTGATNANPIVITTSVAHGLSTGQRVSISGVLGNTAANGNWTVTVLSSTTFSIPATGNGAYSSGGKVVRLSIDQYFSDIPSGAIIATSSAISGKTTTGGLVGMSQVVFSAITGPSAGAVILYKDTGTPSTSILLIYDNAASGLPTPTLTGQDVLYSSPNGVWQE